MHPSNDILHCLNGSLELHQSVRAHLPAFEHFTHCAMAASCGLFQKKGIAKSRGTIAWKVMGRPRRGRFDAIVRT